MSVLHGLFVCLAIAAAYGLLLVFACVLVGTNERTRRPRPLPGSLGDSEWPELDEAERRGR